MEEPAKYDSDKEIKSDDIEKSSTLISPKDTPVITELTNVFSKDNTLIPAEVTLVITEFVDVFSPMYKLPLMCDTQNIVESDSEEVVYQVDKQAYEGEDIAHSCTR